MNSIASKVGCAAGTLRKWKRQAECDQGLRSGLMTDERAQLKQLQRENRELKRANEILRKASDFCPGGARPRTEVMVSFIDPHREAQGVESICRQLPIAPSSYCEIKARQADP